MNDNHLRSIDNRTYVLHLIESLPPALAHHTVYLEDLHQALEALGSRTCTGHEHWRDKDTPGKTPKLYILHGTDQTCPLHGQPGCGGRLRIYVGNKPDKIADALAAIEREEQRLALHRKLHRLDGNIDYLIFQLKGLYRHLHHQPPERGEQQPAIPIETDPMMTN